MKLPANLDLGVQKLSTVDPGKPMEVANAEKQTTEAMVTTLNKFGDLGETIYKRDASGERNSKKAKYHMEEAKLRAKLESDPYERMPDGTLRSRHTDVVKEYEEGEAELRNRILDETENSLAQSQLGTDFQTSNSVTHTAVEATAAKWANQSAFLKNDAAYTANLQGQQWDEGRRVAVDMLATGQITEGAYNDKLEVIASKQTYYGYSNDIADREYVTAEQSKARLEGIHAETNISDAEKKALQEKHYKHQEDMFAQHIRTSIEDPVVGLSGGAESTFGDRAYADGVGADMGGLAFGEFQIREMTFMSAEKLGLSDEREKRRLIQAMESTLGEYRLKAEANVKSMQASRGCAAATNNTRQMSRTNIASATDIVLNRGEGKDVAAMNCAYDNRTRGLKVGSREWETAGPGAEITEQGFMSQTSESWFKASFANAGTPEGAKRFAEAVLVMERLKSVPNGNRAFNFLTAEEKVLAEEVANLSRAGMATPEAVTMLTKGMSINDEAAQKANLDTYKADGYLKLKDTLTTAYESGILSTAPFENVVIPPAMVADYDTLLQPLIKRFGDKPSVHKAAQESLMNRWSSSDRGVTYGWTSANDKIFRKDAPETKFATQAKPENLIPALEQSYEELFTVNKLDKNDYEVGEGHLVNGKFTYFVTKRGDHTLALGSDGHPISWAFDYEKSTYNKLQQLEAAYARNQAETIQRTNQLEANVDPNTTTGNIARGVVRDISNAPGKLAVDVIYPVLAAKYKGYENAFNAAKDGMAAGAEAVGDINDKAREFTRAGQISGMGEPDDFQDSMDRSALTDLYKYDRMKDEQYEAEKARILKKGNTR